MNHLRTAAFLTVLLATTTPLTALSAAPKSQKFTAELQQRLERAELLAGLTPVEGPGVFLTLRHSAKMLAGVDPQTLMLQEQDLNAVIAALRTGGAEALAVSGRDGRPERWLATSAARESGAGVLVNGITLEPPYQIYAIGDAEAMQRELMREGGVVRKAGLDALEMIEIHAVPLVSIPAAPAVPTPRFARTAAPSDQPAKESQTSAQAVAQSEAPTKAPRTTEPEAERSAAPERSAKASASKSEPRNTPVVHLFGGEGYAKYHAPDCRLGERIPSAKRVVFRSIDAARKDGRTPCSICLPNGDPR